MSDKNWRVVDLLANERSSDFLKIRSNRIAEDETEEYYMLDNSFLRSKSEGMELRYSTSLADWDADSPIIQWDSHVFGSLFKRSNDPESLAIIKKDEVPLLTVVDRWKRKTPIYDEPDEWLEVRGTIDRFGDKRPVVGKWYLPSKIGVMSIFYQKIPQFIEVEDAVDDADDDSSTKIKAEVQMIEPPEELDSSLLPVGNGAFYKVVAKGVFIRTKPSLAAPKCDGHKEGQTVEMFGWDATREWRQVVTRGNRVGWMKLDHDSMGALLRPDGFPFHPKPIFPLAVAAWEGNADDLKKFIQGGDDIDHRSADGIDGMTPLMLAVSRNHILCAFHLIKAFADLTCQTPDGKTFVDFAKSIKTQNLLAAIAGLPFDIQQCTQAIDLLEDTELENEARPSLQKAFAAQRRRDAIGPEQVQKERSQIK